MSLSGNLSPSVVKTALDLVVYPEFDAQMGPNVATAEDAGVFMQGTANNSAVISEIFKGVGIWGTREEEANVPTSTPRVGNQQTHSILNYSNSVDITKNLFDDDMHSVVANMMREFGEKARISRDSHAMGCYRNAFTTTLTNAGDALFSATHTTLSGDNVDNLDSSALSESSLNTGLIALAEQLDQTGTVRGNQASTLLVPASLFKTAVEITDSELRQGTGNNDMNVYSDKYGIIVKQSPYLGSAAGGSNTAWFLLTKNHNIHRWVRQGLETALVDWTIQRNNNYVFKGEYRETCGATTYEGAWGSTGT